MMQFSDPVLVYLTIIEKNVDQFIDFVQFKRSIHLDSMCRHFINQALHLRILRNTWHANLFAKAYASNSHRMVMLYKLE